MSSVFTYPDYVGGSGPTQRVHARTAEAVTPLSHDVLLMFVSTCAVSACLTLAFLILRFIRMEADGPAFSSFVERSLAHPPGENFRPAREAFLAGMLSERAHSLKTQVRFISTIITAHLASHPEPEDLAYRIVSESVRADYDPLFVAAVIRSESTFRRTAVSNKGAQGLMQIMPGTGQYVSKLRNLKWSGVRTLHDPDTNLRLGIAYLKYLEEKFKGNRERVLVAYNWGPANLEQALKNRRPLPSQPLQYARKIMHTHRQWKSEFTQLASAHGRGLLARVLG